MRSPFRRVADGAAGAIVATVLLAGGAAYAATTGFDDNPRGDTPATDDRLAGASGASSTSTSSSSTSSSSTSSTSSSSTSSTSSTSTTVPSTSTPSTSTPSTTVPSAGTPTTGGTSYAVLDAGSVTVAVDGAVLRIVRAEPATGWVVRVERDNAREVELSFIAGGARVDFNAELEDGQVRIRIRDRRTDTVSGSGSSSSSSTSTTLRPGTDATAVVRTLAGKGGSVTVRQSSGGAILVAATPAPGYSTDVRSSGPDKVEVRFSSGKSETRIETERKDGQWRDDVEDR